MLPGLGWHDRVLDVLEVVRLDRPVCPCAGRSTLLDDFGHTTGRRDGHHLAPVRKEKPAARPQRTFSQPQSDQMAKMAFCHGHGWPRRGLALLACAVCHGWSWTPSHRVPTRLPPSRLHLKAARDGSDSNSEFRRDRGSGGEAIDDSSARATVPSDATSGSDKPAASSRGGPSSAISQRQRKAPAPLNAQDADQPTCHIRPS